MHPFPHGSLHGTLVHAAFANLVWRKRREGSPRNSGWKEDDFPTFESLKDQWGEEQLKLMDFVSNLTNEMNLSLQIGHNSAVSLLA